MAIPPASLPALAAIRPGPANATASSSRRPSSGRRRAARPGGRDGGVPLAGRQPARGRRLCHARLLRSSPASGISAPGELPPAVAADHRVQHVIGQDPAQRPVLLVHHHDRQAPGVDQPVRHLAHVRVGGDGDRPRRPDQLDSGVSGSASSSSTSEMSSSQPPLARRPR